MHEQHSFVRINQAAKSKGFGFASRKLNESQFADGLRQLGVKISAKRVHKLFSATLQSHT